MAADSVRQAALVNTVDSVDLGRIAGIVPTVTSGHLEVLAMATTVAGGFNATLSQDRLAAIPQALRAAAGAGQAAYAPAWQLKNANLKGLLAVLLITVAGTGSLSVRIDATTTDNDTGSFPITVATTGVTTAGVKTFLFYPGAAANAALTQAPVECRLPVAWRAVVLHSDTSSWNYSLTLFTLV